MSVRIMAQVWEIDLPDSEKLVLLALADSANDDGACWPSMATLARKCSKSDRTVQAAIKALVEAGHLTRREVPGKGCNYTLHPRKDFTPNPRSDCTPEKSAPPKGTTLTPEAASDKPSRTIITTNSPLPPKPAAKPKTQQTPKFAMPADWKPGPLPTDVAALADLWPPGRLEREAANVRDYWLDRPEKRPGWDRTFHNRIREIHDRVMRDTRNGHHCQTNRTGSAPRDGRSTLARVLDDALEEIDRFDAQTRIC